MLCLVSVLYLISVYWLFLVMAEVIYVTLHRSLSEEVFPTLNVLITESRICCAMEPCMNDQMTS